MSLNLKKLSDEKLMLNVIDADILSYNELYRRHSGKTYGFLLQKTKNETKASDLHQIIWEKVYTKCKTFNPDYKFTSWVFQICYNAIVDDQRKELRDFKLIDQLKKVQEIEKQMTGVGFNPEELNINHLKSPYKEAIFMRYNDGLDISSIAKKMNIKEPNARKILSRGLKMLKKNFKEQEDYES